MTNDTKIMVKHQWELPGNYPVFIVVMAIYHYVDRIGDFLLPLIFCITYTIIRKHYTGEPVNIHILSLINIFQDNDRVITTKKGKVKFLSFCGNGK